MRQASRVLALLAIPTVAALAVPLLAAPAAAIPPVETFEPFADARLWVDARTANTATVCASGTASGTGTWTFRVVGPTVNMQDSASGATYTRRCALVPTAGLAVGAAAASLLFMTAGGQAEPLADCEMTVAWTPGQPPDYVMSACSQKPAARTDGA